jgi:hypothetical protein
MYSCMKQEKYFLIKIFYFFIFENLVITILLDFLLYIYRLIIILTFLIKFSQCLQRKLININFLALISLERNFINILSLFHIHQYKIIEFNFLVKL